MSCHDFGPWILYSDLIHVMFVFSHELYPNIVICDDFHIWFMLLHELNRVLFFIFDSDSVRVCPRTCSDFVLSDLFHDMVRGYTRTVSDSVLHIWFMFRSCSVTNTVWRCNSPDLNLDIVRVFTRTVSESVLHIWFMFYSCLVTNTVWRQRSLPNYHIWILIWFRLCSDHDTVRSYRICVMILFVSWHKRYMNTIRTFDIMIWFILCLLRYRWCIAMLCRYDSWIYVWYEPWSDAYMHRVWFGRCMVWLHRLFGLSKTKTVLWCMTCIKERFEWCVMYVDYAPMRFLIAMGSLR